jgi:hypothetical protein
MTSDVACARPLSPGSGEGRRLRDHGGEESGCPIKARAAGPVAPDRRLGTLQAYACSAISTSSVVTGLELDVWLTRSLRRYAARNFSSENTVLRDRM